MPFIESDGINLYYEVHGDGTPIVLAHGRGGSHLSWWQQVPTLSKNHKVILFDHRGFGYSQDMKNGPGRAAYKTDLRNLLDHLGVGSGYLVGQSMGGWTALSFAISHPERTLGLFLADSSAGINEEKIFKAYGDRPKPPENVVDRALGTTFKRCQLEKTFLYSQISGLNHTPPSEALSSLLLSRDGPTSRQLAEFSIPTEFIVGEEDVVVTPSIVEICASFVKGSLVHIIPNAGHSVYFERPEIFNDLLLKFIARTCERQNWDERSRP